MKKILSVFVISLLAVCLVLTLSACQPADGGDETPSDDTPAELSFSLVESGEYYIVSSVGGLKDAESIEIPSTYNDLPVSTISKSAFANCKNLKSVTIPASIESIESYAFSNCQSLANVIFEGAPIIDKWAFHSCSSLTIISITEGNVNSGETVYIGEGAFLGCHSITEINLGAGINNIANAFMDGSKKLTKVTVTKGRIGTDTFADQTELTTVYLGASITELGSRAFANCPALTDIHFAGTAFEWRAIEKDSSWNEGTSNYTIHCTDGDITK